LRYYLDIDDATIRIPRFGKLLKSRKLCRSTMRVYLSLAGTILLAGLQVSSAAPQKHQIARSGDSSLRVVVEKKTIEIKFHTFIAKKSDPWFPSNDDDYNELSFIQRISIYVDGQTLWVPRSAYVDLFNARAAAILFEKGSFVLSIAGADGADAYQARIYFDSKKVIRRAVYDLEASTEEPSEETRYAPPQVLD
jgi:hypothetical protein